MRIAIKWFIRTAEFVAAIMMAAMFLTFILQILVRYTAPLGWLAEAVPLFEPSRYGWTLEFCLALWVWIIFWGAAFVVRESDHVSFDMVYHVVSPKARTWFAVIGGLAVCAGLLWSMEPTWSKFHILRLKRTATLDSLLGDWIRMRDIYSIYMVFLLTVSLRYAWRVWTAIRHGADNGLHRTSGAADQ
ncbi:TRAP transporter small permease [Hoeflea sp.]|uniref:TRAP transporter small permease n=1 Tax=Hoeflea sp. TaxID=1940281 RepID=UPI003B52E232